MRWRPWRRRERQRPDWSRILWLEHDLGMHAVPHAACRACTSEWAPSLCGEPDPLDRMGVAVVISGKGATVMSIACPECGSTTWHGLHPKKPLPPRPDPRRRQRV